MLRFAPSGLARARRHIARRPWIHWLIVGSLATVVGAAVAIGLAGIRREREAWGTTRPVLVALRDIAPGEPLAGAVEQRELPLAAIAASAIETLPSDAAAVHALAGGETIVASDVADVSGPRAMLPEGWAAIDIADAPNPELFVVGDPAMVLANGEVVAATALVVDVTVADVVVAVPSADAARVAQAANQRAAVVALAG